MTTDLMSNRLPFNGIDADTVAALRDAWQLIRAEFPALLDSFYDHLAQFEATSRFLKARDQMSASKTAMIRHWEVIAEGLFGERYLASVTRIGAIHYRLGLDARWYIGGYSFLITRLVASIAAKLSAAVGGPASCAQITRLQTAIIKAALLDLDLVISVYTDTGSRERDAALAQKDELQQKVSEAKSNFLATMSHEIRTPLNGILGMAQALLRSSMAPAQREQVGVIVESAKMLKTLLDDVLDFSKIEADRMEITPVDQELRQIFLRQQWLWRPRAEEKGLALRLDIDASVPDRVRVDPTRLGQCITNLVSNAIKFTRHGEVRIQVASERRPDGIGLIIAVGDTGIGISEETLGRLFAPFTQAEGSIARRFGGSGLGLVITRKLAQAMGGDVAVKSEVGKGSVFTLTIVVQPVEKSREPQRAGPAGSPYRAPSRGRRILLVDDHPLNRRIACMLLAPEGFIITEAEDGQQALTRLTEQAFDLVLLDMHMPVMDGMETLTRIRTSDQPWSSVPIIALTADAMSGDRERYLAEGMDGYLAKPIEQRDLLSEIARLLDGSREPPARCAEADLGCSSVAYSAEVELKPPHAI